MPLSQWPEEFLSVNGTAIYQENAANICVLPTRLPNSIHPAVDYIQAIIVVITMVLGILMNACVLYLIGRYRVLQKMTFFLALQLIVAHLVFSSTVLPFMFVTSVLREWHFGDFLCQLLGSIHDLVITSRYLLTFVLTMDRMVSIFYPFFHSRHRGKMAFGNSALAWIISVVRSVTSLRGALNCTNYVPTFKMCSGAPFCSDVCRAHTLLFSTILAMFGVVIPFLLYVVLFYKVNIIKCQLRKLIPSATRIAPLSVSLSPEVSGTFTKTGEEHVNHHARVQERHDHRATVTFLILTAVIIGFALPPYIIYAAQKALGANSPPIVTILQIFIGRTLIYSLAVADPIIILRNRDVRELLKSEFSGLHISH